MTDTQVFNATVTRRYGETSQAKGWLIHVFDASGKPVDEIKVSRDADNGLGSAEAIYEALSDRYDVSRDDLRDADLEGDNPRLELLSLRRRG
ncbi:hypothetical protein [Lysinibacter cavernae]|uniref:Uncharacterized protein n=1 Tax=Lysinibacter cavernae TaxID=1640652 RepID=A0A7X5R0J1_9MICO|nr:hypothetical protein [Lysinibacter cavernae]NIH53445.1 hypothetical protein [Lysinibacter cavernae]